MRIYERRFFVDSIVAVRFGNYFRYFHKTFAMPKIARPPYPADVQRRAVEQVLLHQHSLAQVAKQFRCSKQSIQRWLNKHRSTSSSTSSFPQTTFLPLQVGNEFSSQSSPTIEIITKTGLILRFPVAMPSETLCGIIRQLEEISC